jgi:Phosphotransferase enzyme family
MFSITITPTSKPNAVKGRLTGPPACIRGRGDLWGKIACALGTEAGSIVLDSSQLSPGGNMVRCRGRVGGSRRFFAKIYLSSFHPVFSRFPPPWEEAECEVVKARRVCAQIDTEWNWAHRFRALPCGHEVPAPLGKSCRARTIVWEEARGERLDSLARQSWLRDRKGEVVGAALFQAGKWLKTLHSSSETGMEMIDLTRAVKSLELRMQGKTIAERRYIGAAIQILRYFMATAGPCRIQVPLTLTHSDFCLANFLWDRPSQKLTVVDFELCGLRSACHDLFSLISDLRFHLLFPWIPQATIRSWEKSFWKGYGPIEPVIPRMIGALAQARVFYHYLPHLLTRKSRYGWAGGVTAFAYRTFLERWVIRYRLGLPPELEMLVLSGYQFHSNPSPFSSE